MQLEMEKLSLAEKKHATTRDRLERMEQEIATLKENSSN